ncbi:MAG: DegT/DnrJ/EryC1/StrS family aminotransferase, partial [Actinomycetota bacterium]
MWAITIARVFGEIAKEKDLFVVEDSCDAVGATYDGKPVGSFGDLASA